MCHCSLHWLQDLLAEHSRIEVSQKYPEREKIGIKQLSCGSDGWWVVSGVPGHEDIVRCSILNCQFVKRLKDLILKFLCFYILKSA